jgi:glycyl-tRNA synthetase
VDHQSLEDNTVTIRFRDTMTQDRVSIDKLAAIIDEKVSFKKALQSLR